MTLVRTKNQDLFPSFSNLFDEFFNTELGNWRRSNYSSTSTTLPRVNISENEKEFSIEMAAPGMKKDDFHVEVDNDMLTIHSEVSRENEEKDNNYTRKEFSYQSFKRSFFLPEMVEADKIKAKYTDGILSLIIPKKEEGKRKPVKSISIS